jgi:phosphoadenosine phosphosulfate reductase
LDDSMTATFSSTSTSTGDSVAGPAAAPVALRRRTVLTPAQVADANRALEGAAPQEIVAWATATFGRRLVLTASFAETTLIDIATGVDPDIEVIFLDTGFHFAETLGAVRRGMERYSLNLTVLRPAADAADVWAAGSEACCEARKKAPLERYMTEHADAWLSGLRRADDPGRADAPIVSVDRRGLVKVNPIVAMSDAEYEQYNLDHDVVVNTLRFDGYASIGCWPCTEPSTDRSGRWAGSGKTECGLHL